MSFILEKTKETTFSNIDSVLQYVEWEKKYTARISIADLLDQGAFFYNDKFFGTASFKLHFNKPALDDLCNLLGFYSPMLEKLESFGLASDVLNDLIKSKTGKEKTKNFEFVFDEATQTILGCVSKSYLGYSNQDFLNDVFGCLSNKSQKSLFEIPDLGAFQFKTSYSINTHLYIRLQHNKAQGVISGKGGEGKDISVIGLQLSNTMSGGKALKMDYFVERLVCANGLILPVGGAQARLIHSGTKDNFNKRLSEKMSDVIGSLATAKKTIESLGDIIFNPDKLASNVDLKSLFSIIPDRNLKQEAIKTFSVETHNRISGYKKEEREQIINAEVIKKIPDVIGGEHSNKVFKSYFRDSATMFDFINVLTEEAHNHPPQQRLQIEKTAGDLADYITKHKKKFI